MCINDDIKVTVKRLKILYRDKPIEDILKARGIVLIPISGPNISKGAYKKYNGIQYIYYNTSLSAEEKLTTLVHEWGHSILHPDIDTFELKSLNQSYFLNRYEKQAELFAAEFILPDSIIDDISGCFCEVGDGKSIYELASDYNVTEDLVITKLNNLDLPNITNLINLMEYYSPSM